MESPFSASPRLTEHSKLITSTPPDNPLAALSKSPASRHDVFIMAGSFGEELKLTAQRCILISLQMLSELGSIIVAIIFVGQLPDSALYLAGVGFARTFVNVTGTAMAWGFTTSLFTLLPQSIGAGHARHAAIHIQRSFYVVSIVSATLSIAQFFAGDIMVAIGQPKQLQPIVNTYSRLLIPYIFLTAYSAILMRVLQSLDLNVVLTWCALLMLAACPPLTWFFMFFLDLGYIGAAIAQNLVMLLFVASMATMIVRKGYGFVFVPLELGIIFTKRGISHYLALAIPGLFQNAFEWIIEEVAVILAGYVASPTIALSTTVILSNLFLVVISFSVGICNATNIRVGKYIGCGNIRDAKRAALAGCIIACVIMTLIGVLFYGGRHALPRIYTDNDDVISLTANVMGIMVAYCCGCIVLQTVGGIYRGMGIQKVAAVFVFGSYWVLSLPLSIILLFVYDWRSDLHIGVAIIWGSLGLGNVIGCVLEIVYLLGCADWKRAVGSSEKRIQHTLKEYQSNKERRRERRERKEMDMRAQPAINE